MTDLELDKALRLAPVPPASEEWKPRVRTAMARKPWKRGMVIGGLAACAALGAAFHDGDLGTASFENGKMKVSMTTRVEPIYSKLNWMSLDSMVAGSSDWTSRVFYDRSRKEVFGYELKAKPVDAGKFEIEVQALRNDPRQGGSKEFRWTGLEAIPLKRVVGQTESIVVELKRDGNARLVDAISVTGQFEPVEVSMRKAPLRLIDARLFEDGKLIVDNTGGGVSGKYAVIYLDGGRKIQLGLDAGEKQERRPVGWVDGAVMEFEINGHRYRVEAREAITDGPRQVLFGVEKRNPDTNAPAGFGTEG